MSAPSELRSEGDFYHELLRDRIVLLTEEFSVGDLQRVYELVKTLHAEY